MVKQKVKTEERFFSDTQSIAEFLGVSRMQLYRWNKAVPLPQWHSGFGHRCYRVDSWTEQQVLQWRELVKEYSNKHKKGWHSKGFVKAWKNVTQAE